MRSEKEEIRRRVVNRESGVEQENCSSNRDKIQEPEKIEVIQKMSFKEHVNMYRKFFIEKNEKYPIGQLPQKKVDLATLFSQGEQALKATWLGHSSILMNIDGYKVITDPIFTRKVSPIGPVRFNTDLPLEIEKLPTLDAVIVSHDHYDHLHKPSIKKLVAKTSVFVVPRGVGMRLKKWGIPGAKIVELRWWEECKVNNDLKIAATPSRHFSGRSLFDRNRSLWASWVIETKRRRVFFSGDSGYFPGFKAIGERFAPFDVAFMECGAYNTHWANVHMFPEQSVQASRDVGAKIVQPIHWATFNLALHPWYEPIERFKVEAIRKKSVIATPCIGEVANYDVPPSETWWREAMQESQDARAKRKAAKGYGSDLVNT